MYNTILKLIDEISHRARNPFIEAKDKKELLCCLSNIGAKFFLEHRRLKEYLQIPKITIERGNQLEAALLIRDFPKFFEPRNSWQNFYIPVGIHALVKESVLI